MNTITTDNLFFGGAGLYGAIGDGFEPGISLEVRAQLQIECIGSVLNKKTV